MRIVAEASERSPKIYFKGDDMYIVGRSYMNNAVDFYRNIIKDIDGMVCDRFTVTVCLDYFNTSSSKCILEIFKAAERKHENGAEVKIIWKYKSKYFDMHEAGEDYRDLFDGIDFEITEIDSDDDI